MHYFLLDANVLVAHYCEAGETPDVRRSQIDKKIFPHAINIGEANLPAELLR